MAIGQIPFNSNNRKKLYDDILYKKPAFPDPVKHKEYAISEDL